jgi:spore coat protein U-like protein
MTDCNQGTFDPRSVAGDRTKSFEVRLPVARTCSVATTAVDFGKPANLEAELNATGNISVTCNFPGAYNVSLGSGNNAGGSGSRRMKLRNGTETIPYQLFDKNNQPWGDDVSFGKKVKSDSNGQIQTLGKGGTDILTVVGKVPAQKGAKPSAGTYEDSVVVTLTY